MTIQQILLHQGSVFMYAYNNPIIVDKIRDRLRNDGEAILRPNELVVVGSHDNIFEVMLVLVSNGVEYPFIEIPYRRMSFVWTLILIEY